MTMLIEELAALAGDPLAWGAVLLLGGFAVYALWHWRACPLLRERARITREEAAAAMQRRLVDGPRFLLLMLGGIAATVTGLTFIAQGVYPAVAFYLLLAGLFVTQTEPARRDIRHGELRVIAAEIQGEDAREAALERLRAGHLWLVALHFLLLGGAIIGLTAV